MEFSSVINLVKHIVKLALECWTNITMISSFCSIKKENFFFQPLQQYSVQSLNGELDSHRSNISKLLRVETRERNWSRKPELKQLVASPIIVPFLIQVQVGSTAWTQIKFISRFQQVSNSRTQYQMRYLNLYMKIEYLNCIIQIF